ncbi:27 kDa hemolymph protein-like [Lycorma delicatula]|uniref:27 kDa hemolymph protein-like n=1 Tax=Lycorma delicatula TaxID=130591 RepID=UPI003F514E55
MMKSMLVVFFALFIVTSCDDTKEDLLGVAKKGLTDAVDLAKNALQNPGVLSPNSIMDNLPPSINMSALPSIEEGEEKLRKKCEKNGRNGTYEAVKIAQEELQSCIRQLVDIEEIQDEIEKNKNTGDLDIVFKKQCKKMPILKNCVNNFTFTVDDCLEESEKIIKPLVSNITNALDRFICYKEGDRIALFIAEGGPECFNDKREAITLCLNHTYSLHHNITESADLEYLPSFKLEEQECKDINELQRCIVTELEKCTEPTPANIVDSLFNFIRQSTPCAPYKLELMPGASSRPLSFNMLTCFLVFILAVINTKCILN